MKFYLSSYKFGSDMEDFIRLLPSNRKMAYIPNAGDPYPNGLTREHDRMRIREMQQLLDDLDLGITIELFDLRNYFGRREDLYDDLAQYGIIWVRGGNVYVLQKAMERVNFGSVLRRLMDEERDMLYAGYSAGVCILAPSLEGIHLMDDLSHDMYGNLEIDAPGLGILDYLVIPHYDSPGHPETHMAPDCIAYMEESNLPYRKLRDGEVIILE